MVRTADAHRKRSDLRNIDYAPVSRDARQRWLNWIPPAVIAAVFVAYLPAIGGGFIWDDDFYVASNQTLRTVGGLGRIWFEIGATPQYYPLVFSTFWVEYHLFGLATPAYHIINILLHAGSAILLWRILLRLEIPGAIWAALLFALHPVHVESVAWITERKNVLSGILYLASVYAFLRFELPDGQQRSARDWKWYGLSLALFCGALLSKTVTSTLPAALLVIYWWKNGRVSLRLVLSVLPMFVLGGLAGMLTAWVEKHHVGTKYLVFDLGLMDRVVIAGRVTWFYLGKLLWPYPLMFIYPRWQVSARDVVQLAFPAAAIGLIIVLFAQRRRIGRGPPAAALFFGGTLFPALGFVNVYPMRYSYVADHFQYLASIGPLVLIAALGSRLLARERMWIVAVMILCALGTLTFRQCRVYENLETLWMDTLAKNPGSWMARNNLGEILQARGDYAEAEKCYQAALADPACQDRARVLVNLAISSRKSGAMEQSVSYYKQAIAEQPEFPKALANLGGLLQSQGRTSEAIGYLKRAVQSDPEYAMARNNLGSALLDAGQLQEAITELKKAIELDPEFPEPHYNLGNVYSRLNRNEEAGGEYEVAIRLRSNYVDAHINLGGLLQKSGKLEEAIGHLQTALSIEPNHPIAHYSLGNALARQGRRDEAIQHYKAAQSIRPDLRPPSGFEGP